MPLQLDLAAFTEVMGKHRSGSLTGHHFAHSSSVVIRHSRRG